MLIRNHHGRSSLRFAACVSLTTATAAAFALLPCAPASAQSRDREKESQQQRRQPTGTQQQRTGGTYTSPPASQQQQQQRYQPPKPSGWFNPPTMGSTSPTFASSSPTMASPSPTFGSRQPYFAQSPYPDTALPPMRTPSLTVSPSNWPQQQQAPNIIYQAQQQQRYGSSNSQRDRETERQRDTSRYPAHYPPYNSGGITIVPGGTTVITPGAYSDYGPVMPGGSLQVISKGPRGSVTLFDGFSTIYVPGKTCYSPFGRHYGAPRYIRSACVVTTPWPFLSGYEVSATSTLIIPTVRTAGTVIDNRGAAEAAPQNTAAASAALRNALRDLARFWEDGDGQALRRRVAPDLDVAVFDGERFSYSLRRADFLALSADALDRVQTVSFRFVSVRDRSDGLVNAYGTHVYRIKSGDDAGRVRTATVRYTLAFVDGDWYVSAVSLPGETAEAGSPAPAAPETKTETP